MAETRSTSDLLAAYVVGAEVLRWSIAGLEAEALRARPIPGKMSSLEVVAHIVDSDQFMCDRLKRTIATERPLLVGVESADYPEPLRYHERDPDLDIHLLEVQREQMAADLARLAPEAWTRVAIHSEIGAVSLLDLFEHAVDHLESHVATIAEKRAALGL
ncbi:MAG: DinB family protein [Coriobacteriia bacterium]|nr:DinB family protein [Coriobacteriia bacterium]